MGSSDRSRSDKRRLEEGNGTYAPSNGSHDDTTAHLDKKPKVSSPRDRDRHRDKDRHRSSKDRRDRDHDKDRDRYRDKDRHRNSKDKDRRDRDRDRDRREKEKGKENDTDKGKEKEKTEEGIKMELEEKKEQEAKKKEEEEREEQERLEEEMRKRRERVEAWRREREEQTRKKKEEEDATAAAAAVEASKKWSLDDDEEDEEETATKGDVTATTKEEEGKMQVEEEERDPLDAFMVGIEETVKKLHNIETSVISTSNSRGTGQTIIVRKSISSSTSGESRANTLASSKFDSDGDEDEDEGMAVEDDDHLYVSSSFSSSDSSFSFSPLRKDKIDIEITNRQPKWKRKKALALVDHSKVNYTPFRKNFYIEVPEIARMSEEEVTNYRKGLDDIKVRGRNCPKPIKSFSQAGLSNKLLDVLKKKKFERPTPIQTQAIPAAMSGRDVIGIAKTGSGKTLSFLLPMLRHILDQPPLNSGDGPVGVVMAPTRELAMQIGADIKPFAKACGLRCVCVYGGSGVANQIGDLKRGAEIVVCTPGRMIDMLCSNSGRVVNLRRTTFVVLDEADRMFDMGFEPQIMRIVDNVRPDRQTVMFSATFPKVVCPSPFLLFPFTRVSPSSAFPFSLFLFVVQTDANLGFRSRLPLERS
jgi:ATP-dependent RNA helicase DDX46/PRP5